MKELKFKKIEDSKRDKICIEIEYMSGDGDAEETILYNLPYTYTECQDYIESIQEELDKWKLLQKILDVNDGFYIERDVSEVSKLYGDEICNMYSEVPTDVTCDDYLQSIYKIDLIAFDTEGNKLQCTNLTK